MGADVPAAPALLAWDHDLCRAVVGVAMRTITGYLAHLARHAGVADPMGGGVAIVQRFGGALNFNVHLHALVVDGVFASVREGVRFHPAPAMTTADVADVLATIVPRVRRLLARRGLAGDEANGGAEDRWAEEAPILAGLAAAAVQGRVALGRRAGACVQQCGDADPDEAQDLGPCRARQEGFDLQAAVRVPAGQRDRLERVCRYALRPPVAQDRLRVTDDGRVVLELRRPWADGTTHLVFEPTELLERLAVLTPRPRVNLLLFHGVLGPLAAKRAQVVAFGRTAISAGHASPDDESASARERVPPSPAGRRWAELMKRTFGFDVLACPCGGRLRLVALIEDGSAVRRILTHVGLPTEVPVLRAARPPPLSVGWDD